MEDTKVMHSTGLNEGAGPNLPSEDASARKTGNHKVFALRTFGIEPPCQLGVCVKDEVKLNFAFQPKETAVRTRGVQ